MAPRRFECIVAVVDDEDAVRRALARLIRSLGFEAETYSCGEDFLASLSRRPPACVVLDLHMPKMNGFDVQNRMAETGLEIPTIVITGHDSPETHARALKGGASAYLRKPLDQQTLMDAIQHAVGAPNGNGSSAL